MQVDDRYILLGSPVTHVSSFHCISGCNCDAQSEGVSEQTTKRQRNSKRARCGDGSAGVREEDRK